MKLNESNIKLTENEKRVLNAIRSQGSFFDEAGGNEEVKQWGCCFFGYEVYDEDVKNEFHVNGVVASLVKKGILTAQDDNGITAYGIKYELDFDDKDKIIFNN